jgi:hypothetical protein
MVWLRESTNPWRELLREPELGLARVRYNRTRYSREIGVFRAEQGPGDSFAGITCA